MREHGQVHRGEFWLRCWFCGDSSSNLRKAHLSVNLATGVFHCYRCDASGRLSPKQLVSLGLNTDLTFAGKDEGGEQVDLIDWVDENIRPGPGSSRFSALTRYHLVSPEGLLDVFESRDLRKEVWGYQLKADWGTGPMSIGKRKFAYPDSALSSPVVRLVEGPYDVLTDQDICLFGLPTHRHLAQLRGFSLILCPDGDIWSSAELFKRYFKAFAKTRSPILGVEVLANNLDPDEVPVEDRETISFNDLRRSDLWRNAFSSWKARQVAAKATW